MMTTLTRRTATAACAAALVLATAACNENEVDPTLPPVSQDDSTVTAADAVETTAPPLDDVTQTSAPPTLSAEEQDEADATAALENYREVLDAVAMGEAEIEALNPVSVPPASNGSPSSCFISSRAGPLGMTRSSKRMRWRLRTIRPT